MPIFRDKKYIWRHCDKCEKPFPKHPGTRIKRCENCYRRGHSQAKILRLLTLKKQKLAQKS